MAMWSKLGKRAINRRVFCSSAMIVTTGTTTIILWLLVFMVCGACKAFTLDGRVLVVC